MKGPDLSIYTAAKPAINALKCPECGTLHYPGPMICRKCGARRDPSGMRYPKWDKAPIEGPCTLLTWTKVYALPEGYDVKHMFFGIVEFENGLRASGRLAVEQPSIGMKLTAGVETDDRRLGPPRPVFVFARR